MSYTLRHTISICPSFCLSDNHCLFVRWCLIHYIIPCQFVHPSVCQIAAVSSTLRHTISFTPFVISYISYHFVHPSSSIYRCFFIKWCHISYQTQNVIHAKPCRDHIGIFFLSYHDIFHHAMSFWYVVPLIHTILYNSVPCHFDRCLIILLPTISYWGITAVHCISDKPHFPIDSGSSFVVYCMPEKPIDPGATRFTGLTINKDGRLTKNRTVLGKN